MLVSQPAATRTATTTEQPGVRRVGGWVDVVWGGRGVDVVVWCDVGWGMEGV